MINEDWPPPKRKLDESGAENSTATSDPVYLNYTELINSTILDIYLEPNQEWHMDFEDTNLPNFTWRVVEYQKFKLII